MKPPGDTFAASGRTLLHKLNFGVRAQPIPVAIKRFHVMARVLSGVNAAALTPAERAEYDHACWHYARTCGRLNCNRASLAKLGCAAPPRPMARTLPRRRGAGRPRAAARSTGPPSDDPDSDPEPPPPAPSRGLIPRSRPPPRRAV